MGRKNKYYVVWKGRKKGVLHSWEDCKSSVNGVKGARYKSFETLQEARLAFLKGPLNLVKIGASGGYQIRKPVGVRNFNLDSFSVDAACSGNPGRMEYRGVDTKTGKEIFRKGPFEEATNNIGEFLALTHGLALLKERGDDRPIYSDSRTAISWVSKKAIRTVVKRTTKNENVFILIERAIKWLEKNEFKTQIIKWETKAWGEIPADFGRK